MNPEKGPKLVEYYSNRQRPLIQMAEEQLEALPKTLLSFEPSLMSHR
jgi:hypothetical protein